MGNRQSEPEQAEPIYDGTRVFDNASILAQIMNATPSDDILELRRVNKTFNAIACNILKERGNSVRPLRHEVELVRFLETMVKHHRANQSGVDFPYSDYTLHVAKMSQRNIDRFCTEMSGRVRKLTISMLLAQREEDFLECVCSAYSLIDSAADQFRFGNPRKSVKGKTIQLLQAFPDMEHLCLEVNDDVDFSTLTATDLVTLPIYPKMRVFEWREIHIQRPDAPPQEPENPNSFLGGVVRRTTILEHLRIYRNARGMSSAIRDVPALVSNLRNRPALWLHTTFPLILTGENQPSLEFIRQLSHRRFCNVRSLALTLGCPDDSVMTEVNRFIALQAPVLQYLTLKVYGDDSHSQGQGQSQSQGQGQTQGQGQSHYPLLIPVLPRLVYLKIRLVAWPLTDVQPNPLTHANFPNLKNFGIGQLNSICGIPVQGTIFINGGLD